MLFYSAIRFFIPLTLCLFFSCGSHSELESMELELLGGGTFSTSSFEQNTTSVLFFLSPECPLCLDYANSMREFEKEFGNKAVAFYGIIPTKWFKEEQIENYRTRFGLPFPFILDPDMAFTESMEATTTPQAVILDNNGAIVYSGAIDNWAFKVGKKRAKPTEHYLRDALIALADGKQVKLAKTEPIGCYIE
ncbi:MAG: thiol-disulfide isomerase/thioredoxin [Limisphaerales bacterium]|jgi:thiol-disulfide isomerase/thioredoxin